MSTRALIAVASVLAVGGAAGAVIATRGDNGDAPRPSPGPAGTSSPSTEPADVTTTSAPVWEAALALASDPSGATDLARAIVVTETAILDETTPDIDLAGFARAQQLAYRQLARHPEWEAEATAAVGPDLASVATRNAGAFRDLWALTAPRDELPDWVIVEPPPAEELLGAYQAAETEFGVPWEYLAAINLVETRMGRIRGASTAGAQGPMQFIPSTWEAYGEGDINDPGDAVRAAARYLVAAGAPADMPKALFAYNHSDHYVDAVEAHASVMRENERAYFGYYHWQVYYRLASGDVVLPVGWTRAEGVLDG